MLLLELKFSTLIDWTESALISIWKTEFYFSLKSITCQMNAITTSSYVSIIIIMVNACVYYNTRVCYSAVINFLIRYKWWNHINSEIVSQFVCMCVCVLTFQSPLMCVCVGKTMVMPVTMIMSTDKQTNQIHIVFEYTATFHFGHFTQFES